MSGGWSGSFGLPFGAVPSAIDFGSVPGGHQSYSQPNLNHPPAPLPSTVPGLPSVLEPVPPAAPLPLQQAAQYPPGVKLEPSSNPPFLSPTMSPAMQPGGFGLGDGMAPPLSMPPSGFPFMPFMPFMPMLYTPPPVIDLPPLPPPSQLQSQAPPTTAPANSNSNGDNRTRKRVRPSRAKAAVEARAAAAAAAAAASAPPAKPSPGGKAAAAPRIRKPQEKKPASAKGASAKAAADAAEHLPFKTKLPGVGPNAWRGGPGPQPEKTFRLGRDGQGEGVSRSFAKGTGELTLTLAEGRHELEGEMDLSPAALSRRGQRVKSVVLAGSGRAVLHGGVLSCGSKAEVTVRDLWLRSCAVHVAGDEVRLSLERCFVEVGPQRPAILVSKAVAWTGCDGVSVRLERCYVYALGKGGAAAVKFAEGLRLHFGAEGSEFERVSFDWSPAPAPGSVEGVSPEMRACRFTSCAMAAPGRKLQGRALQEYWDSPAAPGGGPGGLWAD